MIDKTPYTPGMREVLKLSKAEAGRLGHDYIGPEHYLLGVIRKGDGLAIQTMMNLDVDPDEVKLELERMVEMGKAMPMGLFSPNADAKQVLEKSKQISTEMQHGWVGTEHLLLALLKEENTLAGKCLRQFGLESEKVRKEVLDVIAGADPQPPKDPAYGSSRFVICQSPDSGLGTQNPIGDEVKQLMTSAYWIARELEHATIWPEHLFLALLKDKEGPINRYLSHFGIDYETARENLLFPMKEDNPE